MSASASLDTFQTCDHYRFLLMEGKADFYIAPEGDDNNPGTLALPFASLDAAKAAVRNKQAVCERPTTVLLRGGTYRLAMSVIFTERDSGTASAPITYAAYPGERPILSGGHVIDTWTVYRDRIYSAQLPQIENSRWRFKQLFCNGRRQICARYPDFDAENPRYGGWAFIESVEAREGESPLTFRWEKGVFPRRWRKPAQGEIFIIPGAAWVSHSIAIREVDYGERTMTLARRLDRSWDELRKGNRFYVQNLLEELDQPGEWCFDSTTNRVYFWPPLEDIQEAEITVPIVDRLIEIRSTRGQPVGHLRFKGLTFSQTLTLFPYVHSGEPEYVDCNRSNSAGFCLFLENGSHCVIEGCTFDQVGGDAIRFHGPTVGNRIVDNEFVEAGAQAICIAGQDFWPYDFPPVARGQRKQLVRVAEPLPWVKENVIAHNHIYRCGTQDSFGAGIHLHGLKCRDNVIAHNHIHDMPHHAIYLSMGFGRNFVEYNDVHDLCFVMADAGGIYSNRWCVIEGDALLGNNNVIRYNLIRNVHGVHPLAAEADDPCVANSAERISTPYFTWGIYFDNSPQRAVVFGNITIGNVFGGVFLGGGYGEPGNCLVANNILVDSSVYQVDLWTNQHSSGNRFLRNIILYRNPEAALLRFGTQSGAEADGWDECDYNLYSPPHGTRPFVMLRRPKQAADEHQTYEQWQQLGYDTHSLIADPLFVDLERGDYRLRPDSPAFALGFRPIPVERIGRGKQG